MPASGLDRTSVTSFAASGRNWPSSRLTVIRRPSPRGGPICRSAIARSAWIWTWTGCAGGASSARGGGVKRHDATRPRISTTIASSARIERRAAVPIAHRPCNHARGEPPVDGRRAQAGRRPRRAWRTGRGRRRVVHNASSRRTWTIASTMPLTTSATSGHGMALEKRASSARPSPARNAAASGSSAPTQNATHHAMEENRRPGHKLGSSRGSMSAGGKRDADSGQRQARSTTAPSAPSAAPPQARAPAPRRRCLASAHRRVARPLAHTRRVAKPRSGTPSRSAPCNPTATSAAISPHPSAPVSDAFGSGRSAARPRSSSHRTRRRRRRTGRDRARAARARSRRANEDRRLACGNAGAALGWPIENVSAPPTGWPSAEITRQLRQMRPRRQAGGQRDHDGRAVSPRSFL